MLNKSINLFGPSYERGTIGYKLFKDHTIYTFEISHAHKRSRKLGVLVT